MTLDRQFWGGLSAAVVIIVLVVQRYVDVRYWKRECREAQRREAALRQLVYWFALQEGQSAWEHQHAGPILRSIYPTTEPRDFFGKPIGA
jgi:hypothetical protein